MQLKSTEDVSIHGSRFEDAEVLSIVSGDIDHSSGNPDWPLSWSVLDENIHDGEAAFVQVHWVSADGSPRESSMLADLGGFRLVDGEMPDDDSLAELAADLNRYQRGRRCLFRELDRAFARAQRSADDLAAQLHGGAHG
ncbi:MAG: hypothetical protein ACTHU0_22170 [Kofleriaceae bacterium]